VTELLELVLNINGKFIIINSRTVINNSIHNLQQNAQMFHL